MANKQFSIDINNCGFVDPQLQLGAALANEDIRDFRIALDMGADPMRQDDKQMCIFEKALKTHGNAAFVDECLRHGCSPNYINQNLNKSAVNFAADSRDPKIVSALLRYQNVNVDHKYSELTPLNSLAKNLTTDNFDDVCACINLLLSYGASPNMPDQAHRTPLNHILKNRKIDEDRKHDLVKLFLACSNLDIDTYRNGEVRTLLQDLFPDLQLPARSSNGTAISLDSLLNHLRNSDEKKFLQQFKEYQMNLRTGDNLQSNTTQSIEYLPHFIETIKHGMHEAFGALLETGLNVNALHDGNTPIEVAAIWGNWYALEKLLAQDDIKPRREDKLLTNVIGKLDEEPLYKYCDYMKCFYVLLESEHVDINETDTSNSTPLHYAVRYRNRTAIRELLKRGAYIGIKSAFGDLPIDGMHPEVLEEHLDSCITTNGLKPGEPSFEILMNYINLMPNETSAHAKKALPFRDEMTPIAFLAESKEYRHLLQHPLVTSFLFLKWHRLSVIFYINFLFYALFAISIVTHTMLKFRESDHEALTTLFGILSWIGIVYLLLRELTQFTMSPLMYFQSPINLMEIALIVLSVITCSEAKYDRETQRVMAVFTILLVALELVLLVGSLPVLSISTHMLMLRAVATSFLKSFTLYSIFVITFSLCFYILFGKPEVDENAPTTAADENGEFNKFSNPVAALIKTIVMLTGEFDAGDIDFDTLYSYLVFLLFVVFMSIVLFNLLNGLAVSDTQAIKAQAELNGSICRTNLLTRYEEVLTGRSGRTGFIVTHEPFRTICRRLMNLYPNYIAGRQISILPNDRNKVMIPIANSYELKEVALSRTNGVRNSKTTFQPLVQNERQKKLLDPPVHFLPCCCSCITGRCSEMDSRTVKLAMAVIEQKSMSQRERKRLEDTERRLLNIEQKLDKILEMIHSTNADG